MEDTITQAANFPNDPPWHVPFLTRKEAARALRISLAKLDRVIARGELRAKKHGHSVMVQPAAITRYIEQLPDVKSRAAGQEI